MKALKHCAAALVLSLIACSLPLRAVADDEEFDCDPIKSCPKRFKVIELPDTLQPQALRADQAFLLHQECVGTKAGLSCGAWPREVGSSGNLAYHWSAEVVGSRRSLPTGGAFRHVIECQAGEVVTATLAVGNGDYLASTRATYVCGASGRR